MSGQSLLPSGVRPVNSEDLFHPLAGIGDLVAAVDGHPNGGIELPGDIRTVLEGNHDIAAELLVRQVLDGAGGVNDIADFAFPGNFQDPGVVRDRRIQKEHGDDYPGSLEEQRRPVKPDSQAWGERAYQEIARDIACPRDAVKREHPYVERGGGGGGEEDDDSGHGANADPGSEVEEQQQRQHENSSIEVLERLPDGPPLADGGARHAEG